MKISNSIIYLTFLCQLTWQIQAQLTIGNVNIQKSLNQIAHKTSKYHNSGFIIRRGADFEFTVQVQASNKEEISCELKFNENAQTRLILSSTEEKDGNLNIVSYRNGVATIKGQLKTTVAIGQYQTNLVLKVKNQQGTKDFAESTIVLCNPWNQQDDTFLNDVAKRKEYILNENGLLYRSGNVASGFRPSSWNYDQFDPVVMEATIFLLNKIPFNQRSSVISVSRHFSALSNSNDQSGVLHGRWSGDYDDGVAPWVWTGSKRILKQYIETKSPVRYAQCWVFAGLLTTFLRTLGIPSRPITNFISGHDTDKNGFMDVYLDERGIRLESETRDSVWNFHVWTEAWMKRSDLSGKDGWQAVDGTPQERSSKIFQLGPASIEGIRRKEKNNYDNDFVIAEVAADRRYHTRQADGNFKVTRIVKDITGRFIVTKGVNTNRYELITSTYKGKDEEITLPTGNPTTEAPTTTTNVSTESTPIDTATTSPPTSDITNSPTTDTPTTNTPTTDATTTSAPDSDITSTPTTDSSTTSSPTTDGSQSQQTQQETSISLIGENSTETGTVLEGDIAFEPSTEKTVVGSSIILKLNVRPPSNTERTIKYNVVFNSRTYNGKLVKKLHQIEKTKQVTSTYNEKFELKSEQYDQYLKQTGNWFECVIIAEVEGTKQLYRQEVTMDLAFPQDIQIDWINGKILNKNQEKEAKVQFQNPFSNKPLNNCVIRVESGARFMDLQEIDVGKIEANQKLEKLVKLIGKASGKANVNFELDCDEITDIQKVEEVKIQGSKHKRCRRLSMRQF